MAIVQEAQSKLTAKYQTTIPALVRETLGLKKGDKLRFEVRTPGEVVVSREEPYAQDPVLTSFLTLLENDMMKRPEAIRPVNLALLNRARSLVESVKIDLEEVLADDDDDV